MTAMGVFYDLSTIIQIVLYRINSRIIYDVKMIGNRYDIDLL
jgi:hypothetical protein